MKFSTLLIATFAINPLTPAFGADAPDAGIKRIYQAYIRAENSARTPNADKGQYSKRIVALDKALDAACKDKEGDCYPGHDFLIAGQDYKIRKLVVKTTLQTTDKATVIATFTNMGNPTRRVFSMVMEDGRWKIDEIRGFSKEEGKQGELYSDHLKPNL